MTAFLIAVAIWLPLALLCVAFIHGATRKPSPKVKR